MKKIILRTFVFFITLIISSIIYLSIIGIKTDKFNNKIINQVKNIDKNLIVTLKKLNLKLDLIKFKIDIKTLGTNLRYKDKIIELESIRSSILIKSLFNQNFALTDLKISTKSLEIKNLISFLRLFKNDPKLYIAEKFIKKGHLIADIDIEFNENGDIKNNYIVKGFIKNGKINLFRKYYLTDIDLIFELKKDFFKFEEIKLALNKNNILIPYITSKKKTDKFFVSGQINNNKIVLDKNILDLVDLNFFDLNIKQVEFSSENFFNFEIDKNFKIKNFKFNSNANLISLKLHNKFDFKDFFPKSKDEIVFKNHKIKIDYDNKDYNINGLGALELQNNIDNIKYEISKVKKNLNFNASLDILQNEVKLDFLNYKKKKKSILEIKLKGNKVLKNNLNFERVFFKNEDDKIIIKNLLLTNKNKIIKFDNIDLDYVDQDNLKNKINISKNEKSYILKGDIFSANKIIQDLLNSKNKKDLKLFSNNFKLDVDIKKVNLDKKNVINNLIGYLVFNDNKVYDASLTSNFSNKKKISLSIKNKNGDKITTLFSDRAKPFVKRYSFIKGFDEGSLDFYSVKENDGTTISSLKIYDFKLKELPALTKILTLASLQGIADLLSGEGIRFNEFEMNFSNKNKLMTIKEIYAIGPAISILMDGYIEENKLISLRGTLVPATTLNKTIGSIPFLGEILVGKKTGEGVFGVSFKIKGPPKKLETTVNPIKTLTPRFITRTLEKIKKN